MDSLKRIKLFWCLKFETFFLIKNKANCRLLSSNSIILYLCQQISISIHLLTIYNLDLCSFMMAKRPCRFEWTGHPPPLNSPLLCVVRDALWPIKPILSFFLFFSSQSFGKHDRNVKWGCLFCQDSNLWTPNEAYEGKSYRFDLMRFSLFMHIKIETMMLLYVLYLQQPTLAIKLFICVWIEIALASCVWRSKQTLILSSWLRVLSVLMDK